MHRKRPVLGVACAAASGEAPTTTTEGTSTLHDGKTVLPLRVGVRIDPKRLAGWPHELDRRYVKSSNNIMALIYIGLTMMPLLDAGGDCDDNYEKMIITVVMTMMMMTMMMMMMTMTTKMRNMLSMMAAMLMIMVLMTWTAMFTMTTASDYDYGAKRCV